MAAEVLVPTSADEAASLYGDGEGITILAGGTILLPEIAAGRVKLERALMLHRSGLAELRADGDTVRLGAMVSVAALVDSPDEVLAYFARHVADREVRRNATVGGNLCATPGLASQRGDLGAPLIALGARVRSTGRGGERTEPVEDFLAGNRSGRLVLEVEYERGARSWGASGMRRRHAHSYSVGSVAVCAGEDGGLRVGVAGIGPIAVRSRAVERSRDPADVLNDIDPVDDAVASADYRRKVLPLIMRDALDQLERA